MSFSDDSKKFSSRKKTAELKAVAALLDTDDSNQDMIPVDQMSPYKIDENLIQTTSHIKNQRDIILGRIQKMDQSRAKVTKSVFEKVNRDYALQLESINSLLGEKKQIIQKELKDLYLMREKQALEINRHKEILEEARFRHFLEEYSEEQYKEVEEFENRELGAFQSELAHIHAAIKAHEELLDPEDLGLSRPSQVTSVQPEVTRTVAVRAYPASQAKSEPSSEFASIFGQAAPLSETDDELLKLDEEIRLPQTTTQLHETELPPESSYHPSPEGEKSYFESSVSKKVDLPAHTNDDDNEVVPEAIDSSITEVKQPKSADAGETLKDILGDLSLEGADSSQAPEQTGSRDNSPALVSDGHDYKLVIVEGDPDIDGHEFPIKDNLSIGRSPANDITFKAAKVSRQHAAINKYRDQYLIIDLKSSNGVYVNGRKVEEHALEDGDEISIGGYKMIFKKK